MFSQVKSEKVGQEKRNESLTEMLNTVVKITTCLITYKTLVALVFFSCSSNGVVDKNAIEKWGLLEKVDVCDTLIFKESRQNLSFRLEPKTTVDRYQVNVFFPSANSNYYHEDDLEEELKEFKSKVNRQFANTKIKILNSDSEEVIVKDLKSGLFNFNYGRNRPPSIWLTSGIKLYKKEVYKVIIELPSKTIDDQELYSPVLVIGLGHKVSL